LVLSVFDSGYGRSYTQTEFHDLLNSVGLEIRRDAKFRHGILWEFMIAEAVLPATK
jgi:hypothetical protein